MPNPCDFGRVGTLESVLSGICVPNPSGFGRVGTLESVLDFAPLSIFSIFAAANLITYEQTF